MVLKRSLLAAVVCIWPVVAASQTWNPTASVNANTAAGTDALDSLTTGTNNTAVGFVSLWKTTSGIYNAAVGSETLKFNATGSYNSAIGAQALYYNTQGSANTASGYHALLSNITGSRNTASGYRSLQSNSDGGLNTASGYDALYHNVNGGANTAIGDSALYTNVNGAYDTAVGANALRRLPNGNSNVAIGYNALSGITAAATGNTALGANAGYLTKGGSNNIYISNYGVSGNESNVTRIGRTQTRVFIKGIAGVPLSGATVVVKADGQLGVVSSSARYKQDIQPLTDVSETLDELRPVSFSYRTEPGVTHYGLIAEEVDQVMPELVVRDEQNRPDSVQYLELIPLLLQERQEMQAELKRQRELIEKQAEALANLQRAFDTRLAAVR